MRGVWGNSFRLRRHGRIKYHFSVMGSSAQDPLQAVATSNFPISTHAVGDGAVGHPDVGSQHRTLPTAACVWVLLATAVGVANAQLPVVQPQGRAKLIAVRSSHWDCNAGTNLSCR